MALKKLEIEMLTLGMIQTNCYIVTDTVSRETVIIDPADEAPTILNVVQRNGLNLREVWLTHAHVDHVLALADIKRQTGAAIRMHAADVPLLEALPEQARLLFGMSVPSAPEPDHLIEDGQILALGESQFEVRFTPGHTPGHVSFVCHEDAVVFSGDCLFLGSIGRTDLPGGDYQTLMRSIFSKLLTLPEDYTVAPGHMQTTTIAREQASNPFLLDWMGS